MIRKVLAGTVLAAGIAAQALAVAAPSDAATIRPASSGGGCSGSVAVGDGWSFNSCISAHNNAIFPDGYVTASGSRGSSCTIWVDVIRNGDQISHRANPCSVGTGAGIVGVETGGSGTFFTAIYVQINGALSSEVLSPNEYQ
jgi:hypothetical protein